MSVYKTNRTIRCMVILPVDNIDVITFVTTRARTAAENSSLPFTIEFALSDSPNIRFVSLIRCEYQPKRPTRSINKFFVSYIALQFQLPKHFSTSIK